VEVVCQASDNLGVDRVELRLSHNGGPELGPYNLLDWGSDTYELDFPLPAEQLAIGDTLSYTLTAYDTASTPNQTQVGPLGFRIIDTRGAILVLERTEQVPFDDKYDFSVKGSPRLFSEPGKSSAYPMADWLTAAGFFVNVRPAETTPVEDFLGYDLVIYAAGDHLDPMGDGTIPANLQAWVDQGGKLMLEGGEIGYDATRTPGFPEFLSGVLHCDEWDTDNGGDMLVGAGMVDHPILNEPHAITTPVVISYQSYGDQDTMKPSADAYAVLVMDRFQADGGIIIYDDNPSPQSAQIAYLTFDAQALDPLVGPALVENVATYLTAYEGPPSASLSGRARLAGEGDHSGILVDLGNGQTTLTGMDGTWSITDLYPGSYTILASKDGWSVARLDVELGEGEQLGDLDLLLAPIISTDYRIYPGLPIPDDDPAGVISTITVPAGEAGSITDISVDIYIQHTWIGDLIVGVTSPEGTSVLLHARTGVQDINILGNWPNTLDVDGPGTMADFQGENNAGVWTLFVSDNEALEEGGLSMWGLNFTLAGSVASVGDEMLPTATRLHAAVPNPFNPRTTIRYDIMRTEPVRLDIFDLRGRLVRTLVDEEKPAGRYEAVWDGRDQQDRGVASGTYLYRLQTGGQVQDRKMLLIR
jgi:subtilisin-like proprotein convertase family protein